MWEEKGEVPGVRMFFSHSPSYIEGESFLETLQQTSFRLCWPQTFCTVPSPPQNWVTLPSQDCVLWPPKYYVSHGHPEHARNVALHHPRALLHGHSRNVLRHHIATVGRSCCPPSCVMLPFQDSATRPSQNCITSPSPAARRLEMLVIRILGSLVRGKLS